MSTNTKPAGAFLLRRVWFDLMVIVDEVMLFAGLAATYSSAS